MDMTKNQHDLINAISSKLSLEISDVELVFHQIFYELGASLINGESVDIETFGQFYVKTREARAGVSKSGKDIEVSKKCTINFKASTNLKKSINLSG